MLCEGLETNDPGFAGEGADEFQIDSIVGRLWVSVETGYPVLLEAEFEGQHSGNASIDQFQWERLRAEHPAGLRADVAADTPVHADPLRPSFNARPFHMRGRPFPGSNHVEAMLNRCDHSAIEMLTLGFQYTLRYNCHNKYDNM